MKLGEIIERYVERVADVANFSHFIGVDHLDTGDLRLRRWGVVGEDELPPTFRYIFHPGMVLVPTRRPSLRKCALAQFGGLTGEKVLVLKPKTGSGLYPPLAPYLLSSPRVQEWNIEKAIGSVTPHFRWGDMAQCEVTLPPPEEQLRLASALEATEAFIQCSVDAAAAASTAADAFSAEAFRGGTRRETVSHPRLGQIARTWTVCTIGEIVASSQYGLSAAPQMAGRFPILRMMNLVGGAVIENDLRFVDLPDDVFQSYRLEHGDVLFNRTNSIDLVGRTGVYSLEGEHVFASYLVRLKVGKCVQSAKATGGRLA